MPSAASERYPELLGFPISWSFTTSCICLELRPLPSTGITRLPRYYEPLRHPRAPEPSLTGVRLVFPDHAKGLPVLRALPLCTCCRHYPGAATGALLARFPSRVSLPRYGSRVDLRNHRKITVMLNFPQNPSGYTISQKEADSIVRILTDTAAGGKGADVVWGQNGADSLRGGGGAVRIGST